jgi:fatty-acid peroxygenase
MQDIPRDSFDGTIALVRDPYRFIAERCRRHGGDLFRTRILLQDTICMTGPRAAKLFYTNEHLVRAGAAPLRVQKTLFGIGGVQGMDGEAHRHRKRMFMTLMTPERIAVLSRISLTAWRAWAERWAGMRQVQLYGELRQLLTAVACSWAGVDVPARELPVRTLELSAPFDAAGAVGPRHWRARLARRRADRWIGRVIERIRAGDEEPPADSAARTIASHRQLDGSLLPPRVAAVELLNVLRPTVAVSVYLVFLAHAFHTHPGWRGRLAAAPDEWTEPFVQEVRRDYPFFPSVVARVRDEFQWYGYRFPRGARVMLDLHGTNHDARAWQHPDDFRPERFVGRPIGAFELVPQGGGDPHTQHRCAGEWITIELMKVAARFLAQNLAYAVPRQDLDVDFGRLPAMVRSGFVITHVRPVTAVHVGTRPRDDTAAHGA